MKSEYYRQCVLKKDNTTYVSWIPEQYAKVGKIIKLRNNKQSGCIVEEGKWDDGWEVDHVGMRMPEEFVNINSQQHKHHRKNTDI